MNRMLSSSKLSNPKYLGPLKALVSPVKAIIVLVLTLFTQQAIAQLDTCNGFLAGNYIEVGVAPNFGFGSTINTPPGYYPRPVVGGGTNSFWNICETSCNALGANLGFVADPDKDGWIVGSPAYYGDYFLPGTPQEGWAIEIGGIEATAYTTNFYGGYCGPSAGGGYQGAGAGSLSGSLTSYTNNGTNITVKWEGAYGPIAMTQ